MIRSAPRAGREATPHWVAARQGRLELPFCAQCGMPAWPPGSACARCGGALAWRVCSGRGKVLTFSIIRRAVQPEWKGEEPYVISFVELEEGVRLLTNIIDVDPAKLACGDAVVASFVETTDDGLGLPVFSPA